MSCVLWQTDDKSKITCPPVRLQTASTPQGNYSTLSLCLYLYVFPIIGFHLAISPGGGRSHWVLRCCSWLLIGCPLLGLGLHGVHARSLLFLAGPDGALTHFFFTFPLPPFPVYSIRYSGDRRMWCAAHEVSKSTPRLWCCC